MFSILIFQFYSSFIVGSLLTESPKYIKTVKQLLNSPFEFGIDTVHYVHDNFHDSNEESTVKLYNKIMKNPKKPLIPLETGLNLLKNGGFVFLTDASYAYLRSKGWDDLKYYDSVGSNWIKLQTCWPIQRSAIYKTFFFILQKCQSLFLFPINHRLGNLLKLGKQTTNSAISQFLKLTFYFSVESIRKFSEHGILSYYQKVWLGVRPKCEVSELIVAPVDLAHFSSALYVLAAGMLLSTIVLALEVISDYCRKRAMKSKRRSSIQRVFINWRCNW